MQIALAQPEVETAIKEYIAKQGLVLDTEESKVIITAGRGTNGVTASVDLVLPTGPSIQEFGPGEIEILDKPKTDLEPFSPTTAPKPKPKEEKVIGATEPEVTENPFAETTAETTSELFPNNADEDVIGEGDTLDEVTSDKLFGG